MMLSIKLILTLILHLLNPVLYVVAVSKSCLMGLGRLLELTLAQEPSPARLGVAGAFPAPPGGHQESTQPNREAGGDAGSFPGPGCVLPASAPRRRRAAPFVLVVVDGFPKEIELELGRCRAH